MGASTLLYPLCFIVHSVWTNSCRLRQLGAVSVFFLLLQGRKTPHVVKSDPRILFFELGLLVGTRKHKAGSVQEPRSAYPKAGGSAGGICSEETCGRSSAELPVHWHCLFSVCKEPDCFTRCSTFS